MDNQAKKIFVVDDDMSIGDILSMMLEMEGFSVDSFNSGHASIDKSRLEKPDLVLLDYFLPGEDAQEIIANLRMAAGDDLPILLMSASSQAEQLARNLPINEFISKPFQRESLLKAIGRNIN